MPLRAARVGRVGVIGHPVAKTAVVAKAISPGPSPVAKTAVVAAAVTPGRGVGRRRRIKRSPSARRAWRKSWDIGPRRQRESVAGLSACHRSAESWCLPSTASSRWT